MDSIGEKSNKSPTVGLSCTSIWGECRNGQEFSGAGEAAGRRGRAARARAFPCASRPATLSVVLLALVAKEEQGFRQNDLGRVEFVPDKAYARGVLTFLDLLEKGRSHTLKSEYLAARKVAGKEQNFSRIQTFLQDRLEAGCRFRVGPRGAQGACAAGREELHSAELDELVDALLNELPPAARGTWRNTTVQDGGLPEGAA